MSLQSTLQDILQYKTHSLLILNKTEQQNSQHWIKLHKKCAKCCTIKITEKLNFLCVLVLLNRQRIKFISSVEYTSYQQRGSTKLVNINPFIKSATYLLCIFCCTFCCTICCTKCLHILLETLLYFSKKFCLHVTY